MEDKTGAAITSKIKIKSSLVSEPGETFMTGVDADISRLDGRRFCSHFGTRENIAIDKENHG